MFPPPKKEEIAVKLHVAIDRFLGDARIQMLRDRSRETRPLQICYPTEVPLTRLLAWLMDPTEGHGLGDGPIRALLMQAWRQANNGFEVPLTIRNFLSPSRLEAQTFEDCLLYREVPLSDAGKLDLLLAEPRRRWIIAIENKFGAAEGDTQLKRYRKALEKQYPDWVRVLVFLDVYGQPPSDDAWFGMDYEWLYNELRTAVESPWLSEGSRKILSEFRAAIDPEADRFEHLSSNDDLLDVVNDHRLVFELMRTWDRSNKGFSALLGEIFSSSDSLDSKALQQLFKVYWQKWALWQMCIPMLLYAGLLKAACEVSDDTQYEPHRKAVYFRRAVWELVAAPVTVDGTSYWPVVIKVIPEPEQRAGDQNTFRVVAYLVPNRWRSDLLVDSVIDKIKAFRRQHMKRSHEFDPDSDRYLLIVTRDVLGQEVGAELARQMKAVHGLVHEVQNINLG